MCTSSHRMPAGSETSGPGAVTWWLMTKMMKASVGAEQWRAGVGLHSVVVCEVQEVMSEEERSFT